ncbi:DUF2577 domain-containing protein [Roseburia hominis]|uniref:DUF2577 domain-containing protein n=1 Tax=Roseburia hominis TaxID=301301 RepID=UPI001F45C06F|nr:DUF2577 domain-containing protein [Roseburia hominis]
MADTTLAESIKSIIKNYINASDQCTFMYGTVISATPVTVFVNEKLTLGSEFLIVCKHLTDYEYEVEIKDNTDVAGSPPHNHPLSSVKKIKVKNALQPGEKVVVARQQGGQKYLVIDRC